MSILQVEGDGESGPAGPCLPRTARNDGPTRIKLLGDFASPEALCRDWNRMSQGRFRWNDIEVTWEDGDVDFYVIVNRPPPGEYYDPARTIVFQMEPWCGDAHQNWGVKTWGEWARPDPARFLQVRSHRTHLNNAFWQMRATYDELRTRPIAKSRVLASICSPKYFDPGHIRRVDFLKFLEEKNDDVVRVDLYAHDNPLGFASWIGPHPPGEKDAALLPYRYFFAAENNRETNFVTEKLWEPLLAETLCFYWGCPNAADWIDPRAYIAVDLEDFEQAFRTMKDAILADEWAQRIDVIRREKRKVLEHYQFFPTLERVLHHELRLPLHPTDAEVAYHKHFHDALGADIRTACFVHSYTRGGDTAILAEVLAGVESSGLLETLDRIYVVNVGDPATLPVGFDRHAGRVRLIESSPDASRGEAPTLELLRTFASFHPEARILYLHTKGASHAPPAANVGDWRRMLVHFLVERHADAVTALATHDVAGCNLLASPRRHFSGNFWWANARYLRSLHPVPTGDRHEAEWWVLGGENVRAASLHDSGIDHYSERYRRPQYALPASPGEASGTRGAAPVTETAEEAASGTPASLCLVMIVKDEAHIVSEALASIAPHVADFVVVDTGSTDGTQDVIRHFFAARGVTGHVFDRPWHDFGTNRTEALALAREHSACRYLWMLDADDLVEGTPDLAALIADGYMVRVGPGVEYWRPQIFRRDLPWRYVGVLHEYPACDVASPRIERLEGDYRIVSRRLGNRSRDPDKYERDAAVLDAALAREPDNARHAFYLAQSWFDAGRFDRALTAYEKRAAMGGWAEEVFYSRYRAAMCLERLGRPYDTVQAAWEACFQAHPHRAEPLVRAARRARDVDRFPDAYVLARRAAQVARPGPDALFVETADYEYLALDEQAIAAFYCGFHDEAFALCTDLLDRRELPDGERQRIEKNRDYSVPRLQDAFLRHDAALVTRLAARPANANPRVTLVVTSCRRLDLFTDTIRSFINACTDIDLVDRFLCVDDNSSAGDRDEMQRLFPFFEFVFKGPADRGHARSLNLIRDAVRTPWLVHLEDDWQFFASRPYIGPALEILAENQELGQVLFNRNYAETLEDRDIPGGFAHRTNGSGHRYIIHEHYLVDSDGMRRFESQHARRSNAWWPHYSLRPGVVRTSTFDRVGRFDENAAGFEQDYARRYVAAGLRSACLDGVFALHTGRLTTERGEGARPNAYDLNGVAQFGGVPRALPSPHAWPLPAPGTASQPLRVKLVGNWAQSAGLLAAFERQSKGGGRWDDIVLTTDDDADYFVLFNHPGDRGETFVPARTIIFQMEPPHALAQWQGWSAPDPRGFVQVRSHDRFPNGGEWHLGRTWSALRGESVPKTRELSAVVSSKFQDPGQALRIAFLRWLEAHGMRPDIFGFDNVHGYRGYLGSLPPRDKSDGLLPYRYTIAIENSAHRNYYTEKVLDAILAECLPFYWGCTNLEDYIDPRAFIRLPLDDLEASRRIVEEAIASDAWGRRIGAIRGEKRRILDELQFFPVLARVIRGHRSGAQLAVKVINLDRRPDRLESFRSRLEAVASREFCARVERTAAIDGKTLALTPEIRHLFRGNDFGYRRSYVGCALSHLALWEALAAGGAPACLILEDDVTLCHGFEGQLAEICGALAERHPAFDILLLGYSDWQPRPEDDFATAHRAARPLRFDGARYLGGTFAYVISRAGAQKLLAIVARDGIQNGIDRFIHRKEAELEILVASPHIARAALAPPGAGLDSDIQNDFETLPG